MKLYVLLCFLLVTSAYAGVASAQEVKLSALETKCSECHAESTKMFKAGHHAKAWAKDETRNCETCHGASETHTGNPSRATVVSFGKKSAQTPADQNAACLKCHSTSHKVANWQASIHNQNGVTCASCHNVHKPGELKPTVQTCLGCHKSVASSLNKASHHPVLEGKVSCSDCHNPHGSPYKHQLAAEGVNQLCYKCHGDKRGPFVWEHFPVEENCLTCHNVHGSQHPNLLTRRVPGLCQECHAQTLGGHFSNGDHTGSFSDQFNNDVKGSKTGTIVASQRTIARGCTNCHNSIHGSTGQCNTANLYNCGKFFVR